MRTETYSKDWGNEARVSSAPSLSVNRAIKAKRNAARLVWEHRKDAPYYSESLKLAIALSLYNAKYTTQANGKEKGEINRRTRKHAIDLIRTESDAAQSHNILPTIGIEVEVPQIPMRFDYETTALKYAEFFDAMNMPRNRSNERLKNIKSRWEFSPKPSYSAQVQARILSELIQGKFIPHLENSKKPEDVRQYLDENLVSLHINLGNPPQNQGELMPSKDAEILSRALAIGYTSTLRLEHRKTKNMPFVDVRKKGSTTPLFKNGMWGETRLELRGMEVLDSKTYRALYAAQALFGLSFKAHVQPDSIYKEAYDALMEDIATEMDRANYSPPSAMVDWYNDSYEISRVAGRENVASNMRKILERHTRLVRGFGKPAKDSVKPQQPQVK